MYLLQSGVAEVAGGYATGAPLPVRLIGRVPVHSHGHAVSHVCSRAPAYINQLGLWTIN